MSIPNSDVILDKPVTELQALSPETSPETPSEIQTEIPIEPLPIVEPVVIDKITKPVETKKKPASKPPARLAAGSDPVSVPSAPKQPLRAYGPGGEVFATSFDGGEHWGLTQQGVAARRGPRTKPREFTRVLMAITPPEGDPAWIGFSRRIVVPWGHLHAHGIMAGWTTAAEILKAHDQQIDGLILSSPVSQDDLDLYRTKAYVVGFDVGEDPLASGGELTELTRMIKAVDFVTCSSERIAQELRPFNKRVYVVPSTLDWSYWRGSQKTEGWQFNLHGPVRIGLPGADKRAAYLDAAITMLKNRFPTQLEWIEYDWQTLLPTEEANFYSGLDVVLLPRMDWLPIHPGNYAALPAMAGGTAVIASQPYWKAIKHGSTGLIVGKDDKENWFQSILKVVQDRSKRRHFSKEARNQVMRYTSESQVAQIAIAYETMLPKRTAFTAPGV